MPAVHILGQFPQHISPTSQSASVEQRATHAPGWAAPTGSGGHTNGGTVLGGTVVDII